MLIFIRRAWRITWLLVHLLTGLFRASLLFGLYSPATRDRVISHWSARLLRILGVRLEVTASGLDPTGFAQGALLVANHISWLDIFAILATRRVYFVSKHEVRDWPLLGWLAHRAGTLFIQRAKKTDTVRINAEMHALLQNGAWVAVFPEGTSTDGSRLLRFLPSLFQPAVTENLPVIPAVLEYRDKDDKFTTAAAYADDLSFWQSLLNITAEPEIVVRLGFGTPIHGDNRRQLAETAHTAIANTLGFKPASSASACADTPPESPDDPPDAAR